MWKERDNQLAMTTWFFFAESNKANNFKLKTHTMPNDFTVRKIAKTSLHIKSHRWRYKTEGFCERTPPADDAIVVCFQAKRHTFFKLNI